jgi:GT2 family glycosyltransferase
MISRHTVSLIVVSYSTRDLLRQCLQSVARTSDSDLDVIVVDNHSTDDSVAMVRAEFPDITLIENSENVGFAKANNQAIQSAKTRYLLLLNSDTVVRPGAIEAMSEFLDAHPDAGGVACRLLFGDGRIQPSASRTSSIGLWRLVGRLSGLSRLFPGQGTRRFLRQYLGFALGSTLRSYLDSYVVDSSPMEVDTLSGACLMLRSAAVDQVGLLDENFFMYLEDIDYCLRLRQAGWKLYYLPAVEIVHLAGQSSGGRMRRFGVQSYQSLFYFYGKHYSGLTVRIARVLVLITSFRDWAWDALRSIFSKNPVHQQNLQDAQNVIRLCLSWQYSEAPPLSSGSIEAKSSTAAPRAAETELQE